MKVAAVCTYCGCRFEKLACEVYEHNFCCRAHLNAWNSERFSKYNKTENSMNEVGGQTLEQRLKRHELLRTDGGKTYKKYLGRPAHRVIAEEQLGRPLAPDEVVHHIDGDKTNNAPENLQVMSRKAHSSFHARQHRNGGDVHAHV